MGLQIGEIITKKEIQFKDLKGKTLAVDAFNAIYQFLTTIRQPDGTPLKDSKGNITSHISGLFYRNINLIQEGVKTVHISGEDVIVRAHVVTITGYSGHKDSDGLINFVEDASEMLKKVFVVMGEPKSSIFLVQKLRDNLGVDACAPERGDCVSLIC